jgi:hypothetical protein
MFWLCVLLMFCLYGLIWLTEQAPFLAVLVGTGLVWYTVKWISTHVRLREDFHGNIHAGSGRPGLKSRASTSAEPQRVRPSQHVPSDDS